MGRLALAAGYVLLWLGPLAPRLLHRCCVCGGVGPWQTSVTGWLGLHAHMLRGTQQRAWAALQHQTQTNSD